MPEHLQIVDVFVLPSLWEGLPNALLKAEGAGVPVIATQGERMEEIIIDGVKTLQLPLGNPKSSKNALHRVLAEQDLR